VLVQTELYWNCRNAGLDITRSVIHTLKSHGPTILNKHSDSFANGEFSDRDPNFPLCKYVFLIKNENENEALDPTGS